MLAGGSATDLPEQTPAAAALYNVVDSFDTHANIPAHFAAVDAVARETEHVAVISVGWDPGMFSVSRVYANAIMPNGADYTFWGRGVSQGHSDAIRRIPGVVDARQYTVPVPEALEAVRSGANPELTTRQKHTRECFVVAEEGADTAAIEEAIVTMPNYFADYDTTVTFISQEELDRRSRRHSPRRLGHPHWHHGCRRREHPRDRVLAEARFQPGVHRQRARRLRPRLLAHGLRGRDGLPHHLRHRACAALAHDPRGAPREDAVRPRAQQRQRTRALINKRTAHRVVRFFIARGIFIARDNLPLNLGAYFRVVRLLRPARQKKRTQYESFSCLPAPSRSVFPPWFPKPPPTMSNNSEFCTQNGTEIVPD